MASMINDLSELLKANEYPGRGIVAGRSSGGKHAVFAYFIMGRSENSRNRVFSETDDGIRTEAFDPSKMTDPSLIIYHPVRQLGSRVIVTNGDQTDTIRDCLLNGESFEKALESRCFEPDEPNYTPRISALLDLANGYSYKMSILKSGDEKGTFCNRFSFHYGSQAGLGHFIHTYVCDGNPIPTFQGEPERVSIPNSIDDFTKEIWESLDENNKISLYVRYIDLATGAEENRLVNRNK